MSSPRHPTGAPQVVTRRGRRTLEFSPGEIQSEMRLARPFSLVLAYARAMMCFALFVPRPRHIVMVGLGGGSLAKFCHRVFPEARISVLEVRADVIALRTQFCIPPDDARFQVIHADAVDWLARRAACCDVILVDGFDSSGLPAALSSTAFYDDCRRALGDDGVLVANLLDYDPAWQATLARLAHAFDGKLCWFDAIAASNHVVFAVAGGARALRLQQRIDRRHGRGAGLRARLLARVLVAALAWRARLRPRRKGEIRDK